MPSAGVTVGGDQFLVFILADDDRNVADFSGDAGLVPALPKASPPALPRHLAG